MHSRLHHVSTVVFVGEAINISIIGFAVPHISLDSPLSARRTNQIIIIINKAIVYRDNNTASRQLFPPIGSYRLYQIQMPPCISDQKMVERLRL
jgi:hypothetical protein